MQVFNYGGMAADAINKFGDSLGNALAMREQRDNAQQQQDVMAGLADLYSKGATTQELYEYGLQNPAAFERVGQTIGFKNDQTKQIMRDTLIDSLQTPEQRDQIITRGAEAIRAAGGDPRYLSQAIGDSTEDFERGAIPFLASLDSQGSGFAKSYMGMKPQQPKQISPYEQAKLEGEEQDRKLRQQEIDLRRLEFDRKSAKTTQEQKEKSQQIDQKKREIEESKAQDKQALNDKIFLAKNNAEQVRNLLNNQDFIDDLTGISGVAQGFGVRPSQDARDAQIILDNIVSSETLNNLGVMKGPLTDKDVEIIRSASTRLREGMSEKAMKAELKKMLSAYDRVINNYQKEANRKGYNPEDDSKDSSKVVFSSSKYGDVTEADIQTTMQKHNMTREQVMSRLGM